MSTEKLGICTRKVKGGEILGAACPDCKHTSFVHPGHPNPTLHACVICELLAMLPKRRYKARCQECGHQVTVTPRGKLWAHDKRGKLSGRRCKDSGADASKPWIAQEA